jgi:VanZ family protein
MMIFIQVAAWLTVITIALTSLGSPSLRPRTRLPHDLEHFAIFFIMGFAFGLSYHEEYATVAIALTTFAAAIEIIQLATPGRHPSLNDFVVDTLASCTGIGTAVLARWLVDNH